MTRLACILAGILTLAVLFTASPVLAEGQTVRVTGMGETSAAARMDAVRAAMQKVTRQLMVADRVVENDQVILDRVISTMDGLVENFTVHEETAGPLGIEIVADVTVSRSGIASYIGEIKGATAGVDGGSMFAEAQRQAAATQANGDLYDRLFRGFPMKAMTAEIRDVSYDGEIDAAVIEITYQIDSSFLAAMKEGLRPLTATRCRFDNSNFVGPWGGAGETVMKAAGAIALYVHDSLTYSHSPTCEDAAGQPVSRYSIKNAVCFAEGTAAVCLTPKPGTYCAFCERFPSPVLMRDPTSVWDHFSPVAFAVFPRDKHGQLTSQDCVVTYGHANYVVQDRLRGADMPAFRMVEHDLIVFKEEPIDAYVVIPQDQFDLARTSQVDVVPVYLINNGYSKGPSQMVVSVDQDPVSLERTCEVAARAIR